MKRVKIGLLVAGALATVAMVSGCGTESSPRGELAEHQRILATCNPSAPPASLVAVDGSGSSISDAITAERMTAVESVARKTAVCSGYLRVIVFAGSSAATTVLFDGSLKQDGATDNARLKRVSAAVTGVMEKVRAGYGPAVTALSSSGSDITAQYRLAGEWISQLGGIYQLHLYVLTDGFQTVGIDLGSQPLGKQEAAALAEQTVVPRLPGASVVVAGLGRMAGGVPPSNVVEGLVAYYDALCQRTTAVRCASVTAYSTEGR